MNRSTADNSDEASSRIPIQRVKDVMEIVVDVRPVWVVGLIIAILISLFTVSRSPDGTINFALEVKTVTIILIALIWLPALLRVFALAGGRLKALGGELELGGLVQLLMALKPEDRQEVAAFVAASADRAASRLGGAERRAVEQVGRVAEHHLSDALSQTPTDEELKRLAKEYEAARKEPFTAQRTIRLEALLSQVRMLAARPEVTEAYVQAWADGFKGAPEGKRIVALGLLQALPSNISTFDIVVDAILNPKSPFEQYHALRAAEGMLVFLDSAQKAKLAQVIRDRQQGGRIRIQGDRWGLSERILTRLRG